MNIWNTEMTAAEISSLSCRAQGNVVNWSTLKKEGNIDFHTETFPCYGENFCLKAVKCHHLLYILVCNSIDKYAQPEGNGVYHLISSVKPSLEHKLGSQCSRTFASLSH